MKGTEEYISLFSFSEAVRDEMNDEERPGSHVGTSEMSSGDISVFGQNSMLKIIEFYPTTRLSSLDTPNMPMSLPGDS